MERMIIKQNVFIPSFVKDMVQDFALYSGLHYFDINTDPRAEVEKNKRRFCTLSNIEHIEIAQVVDAFKHIAYEEIGITEILPEPQFGNFIGVNLEGGSVHEHQDSRDRNNNIHLRFNFMIQKPDIGGNPIINGKEYWIEENECWMNYASEWRHGSTPVYGDRERIVLSMGACVPENVVREKLSSKIGWKH